MKRKLARFISSYNFISPFLHASKEIERILFETVTHFPRSHERTSSFPIKIEIPFVLQSMAVGIRRSTDQLCGKIKRISDFYTQLENFYLKLKWAIDSSKDLLGLDVRLLKVFDAIPIVDDGSMSFVVDLNQPLADIMNLTINNILEVLDRYITETIPSLESHYLVSFGCSAFRSSNLVDGLTSYEQSSLLKSDEARRLHLENTEQKSSVQTRKNQMISEKVVKTNEINPETPEDQKSTPSKCPRAGKLASPSRNPLLSIEIQPFDQLIPNDSKIAIISNREKQENLSNFHGSQSFLISQVSGELFPLSLKDKENLNPKLQISHVFKKVYRGDSQSFTSKAKSTIKDEEEKGSIKNGLLDSLAKQQTIDFLNNLPLFYQDIADQNTRLG